MYTNRSSLPSLTPKELKVLKFLEGFIRKNGVAPTYSEIQKEFELASINSVQNYLKQLASKGYVDVQKDQKRSLRILAGSRSFIRSASADSIGPAGSAAPGSADNQSRRVPLLGRVAAGQPLEALLDQEFIDVPAVFVSKPGHFFALEVAGDSMRDEGVLDGDRILLRRQEVAKNGEMVVATIDGESTLKRFFLWSSADLRNLDGAAGGKVRGQIADPLVDGGGVSADSNLKKVELRPANSNFKSQWYLPNQVQVRGVVIGLFRSY